MGKLKKNLANCSPEEFLVQTNRIRKSAERWLKATDILNIRKNVPKLDPLPLNGEPEEIEDAKARQNEIIKKSAYDNFKKILDSVLEDNPKETLELLALACFVDPKNVNDYPMIDYLENVLEILNDETVISFFTSLVRLGQSSILNV